MSWRTPHLTLTNASGKSEKNHERIGHPFLSCSEHFRVTGRPSGNPRLRGPVLGLNSSGLEAPLDGQCKLITDGYCELGAWRVTGKIQGSAWLGLLHDYGTTLTPTISEKKYFFSLIKLRSTKTTLSYPRSQETGAFIHYSRGTIWHQD